MAKQDKDMSVGESLDGDSAELRVYELGFHLDPELPTEEVKKAYQAIRELIEGKGSVVTEGAPEMTQLAYTISRQDTSVHRDFDSAYFCWIAYEMSGLNHADVIAAASADKRMIRFIDVLTDKDAARHAAEMRELSIKTPERTGRTEDAEAAAGAELDAALEHVVV